MQVARSLRIRSRYLAMPAGKARRTHAQLAARSDQRQRQVACRYELAARAGARRVGRLEAIVKLDGPGLKKSRPVRQSINA